MQMKKLLTLMILVLFTAWSSYGLVATSYCFSKATVPNYTYIVTGGTQLGLMDGLMDDQSFPNNPIGFPFVYDGVTYTTFDVNVDGYIYFRNVGDPVILHAASQVLAGATNTVAALNVDLKAKDESTNIRYFSDPVAGTLTVQWYNFIIKPNAGEPANLQLVNFQIVLYKNTNVIQIKYGETKGGVPVNHGILGTYFGGPTTAQVCMTGATTANFQTRKDGTAPNQWFASVAGTLNTDVMSFTDLIYPSTDLVYTFTPGVPVAVTNPVPAVSPASNCIVCTAPVTLSWTATTCPAADSYKVFFGTSPTPPSIGTVTAPTTSWTTTALLPNTTYYWKVVPVNTFGDGAATVYSFKTQNLAPLAATLPSVWLSPVDGCNMAINSPGVTLTWLSPAAAITNGAAESFEVYFGTTNPPVTLLSTQNTLSFTTAELALNTTYYWQIKSKNTNPLCSPTSYSTLGSVWSFTTRNLAPGTPTITAPVCASIMALTAPTLTWTAPATTAAQGAPTSYDVTYSTSATFASGNTTVNVLAPTTSYTIPGPLAFLTTYYWKVVAKNTGCTGSTPGSTLSSPASATCSFITVPATGSLSGAVLTFQSNNPIWNATVTATPVLPGYPTLTATTNTAGLYTFSGTVYAFDYVLTVSHVGYNSPTAPMTVTVTTAPSFTAPNIYMYRPEIAVLPKTELVVDVRPGACLWSNLTRYFTVTNVGTGILTWSHSYDMVQTWVRLNQGTTFTAAPSTNSYDSTFFNTTGLVAGNTRTTNVTFTSSNPDVGGFVIPIIMNIVGNPIVSVTNLASTLNQVNGAFSLTWNGPIAGYDGFVKFVVKKNGVPTDVAGNATGNYTWTETLPLPAVGPDPYTYTVEAIYTNGYSTCPVSTTPTVINFYLPVYSGTPNPVVCTLLPGTTGTATFTVANGGNVLSMLSNSIAPKTFVTAVTPATAIIAGGANQAFTFTFSAVGKVAGTYLDTLINTTNIGTFKVPVKMVVSPMYYITGKVTHGVNGDVLPGVVVTTTPAFTSAVTNETCDYSMWVPVGTYSVVFTRPGYQTVTVTGQAVTTANIVVNAVMWESLYAPSCATATVKADDSQVLVEWCLPNGAYELLYDDGVAENFAAWDLAGNMNAVKFTPKGYPAKVTGARFYIGNGAFPTTNTGIIGKTADISVYAAGTNGMPTGDALSTVTATATAFGWVTVTGLNATIASGDFFIVMSQNSNAPNCLPVGVDETLPNAYMSYSKNVKAGGAWILSQYQDFMIHAILESPIPLGSGDAPVAGVMVTPGSNSIDGQTIVSEQTGMSPHATRPDGTIIPDLSSNNGMISLSPSAAQPGMIGMTAMVAAPQGFDQFDAVKKYALNRYPWTPGATFAATGTFGTAVMLSNSLTSLSYIDKGTAPKYWGDSLAAGWYKYGVTAIYATNPAVQQSAEVLTNAVPHKLFTDITVNVKSACGFVPTDGAKVTLVQTMFPYATLTATTTATGMVQFNNVDPTVPTAYVVKGTYLLTVKKAGSYQYGPVSYNITTATKVLDAVIEDHRYSPFNPTMSPTTLVAKWDTVADIYKQDFQDPGFAWGAGNSYTLPNMIRFHVQTISAVTGGYSMSGWYNYDQYGEGSTYIVTSNYSSPNFVIPAHTKYAAINIDSVALVNPDMFLDDVLRTPFMDLTVAPKMKLSFDLFMTGGLNTGGRLWYRKASNLVWVYYVALTAAPAWTTYTVDLSSLAGIDGTNSIQFAWESYEKSGASGTGTGLALDNIKVTATVPVPVNGYGVFLSSVGQVATTTATTYTFNPNFDLYGRTDTLTIKGYYCSGFSEPGVSKTFTSLFLYPPTNLTATANSSIILGGVDLAWLAPIAQSPMGVPGEVTLQYNVSESITSGYSGDGSAVPNTWRAVIKHPATQLGPFGPKFITKINIGLASYDFTKLLAKVYSLPAGQSITTNTPTEVYSEDVKSKVVKGQWNLVTLTNPVALLAGKDYYVGYEIACASGAYPSGMTDAITALSDKNWVWDGTYGWNNLHNIAAVAGYTMDNYNWTLKTVINNGIPANLLSYNLYIDGGSTPFANVLKPTTKFFDGGMYPGNHCYKVSALYDLTYYGLTGVGESTKDGPACVDVNYGYPLPFTENFTTGQFDVNKWTLCDHWIMDGQIGNILPSAKFHWDPAITNYSCSLETFYIDGTKITSATPYTVWLEFDQKFVNRTATGKEKFNVEVWTGSTWTKVKVDSSLAVSYDWKAIKLDITSLVKGKVFKVRWNANGVNSGDIYSWAIDNINIHADFLLAAPAALNVTSYNTPKNDNKLIWTAPAGGGVLSYNIWRRAYSVYPAGANTAGGIWTKIETGVTALEYWDMNLSNLTTNCYEYQVTAVYPEGESAASNSDWECIFVGVSPNQTDALRVYPNPATDYVKMDLTKSVVKIDVYNSLGAVVATKNVQGSETFTLNTREFAAGAYSVKFTNANGETFSRKFIVFKSNY